MKRSGLLWHYFYIALFAVVGIICLCLGRAFVYPFPVTAWGFCWLALAAAAAAAARAARRRGRDFQPLLQSGACGMIGGAELYTGLAGGDAFQQFMGVLWLGLAAAWLIRAVRRLRES